jgi:predicted nucleic acid-binding protein
VLDTNVLIDLIKNQLPAIAQGVDTQPEDARLCMSFVTWAELLKGAERSTRKPEVLRRLKALARQVAVLYPAGADPLPLCRCRSGSPLCWRQSNAQCSAKLTPGRQPGES